MKLVIRLRYFNTVNCKPEPFFARILLLCCMVQYIFPSCRGRGYVSFLCRLSTHHHSALALESFRKAVEGRSFVQSDVAIISWWAAISWLAVLPFHLTADCSKQLTPGDSNVRWPSPALAPHDSPITLQFGRCPVSSVIMPNLYSSDKNLVISCFICWFHNILLIYWNVYVKGLFIVHNPFYI